MTTEDPLISFIHLSRKLLSCDNKQLSQVIPGIVEVFNQSNQMHILSQILQSGLSRVYKKLPQTVYKQITDLLTNEPMINDSINLTNINTDDNQDDSKEENNENTSSNKNNRILIDLPKDLHLFCFNYLEIKDIFNISSVCRYLCVTCRDPNAIYHIEIDHCYGLDGLLKTPLPNINAYHLSTKSLFIGANARDYNKNEQWKIRHFQNLKSLNISYREKRAVHIPKNIELHTLKYDTNYFHGNDQTENLNYLILLLQCVNPQTMKHLELVIRKCMINIDLIKPLFAFSNLNKLSLCFRDFSDVQPEDIKPLIISKSYNNNSYPFQCLDEIEISGHFLNHSSGRDLFVWIMTNGITKKKLKLKHFHAVKHPYIDTIISVLSNVRELYLVSIGLEKCKDLLAKTNAYYVQNNYSSLDYFQIKIDTGWQDGDLLTMQKNSFCNIYEINKHVEHICNRSKSSRLICHSHLLPNYLFSEANTINTNFRYSWNRNVQYDYLKKLMQNCPFESVDLYLRNECHGLDTCRDVINYVSLMNDKYKEQLEDEADGWYNKSIETLHGEIIDNTVHHTLDIIKRVSKVMFKGKSFYFYLQHCHQYRLGNDHYGQNKSKSGFDRVIKDINREFERFIKVKNDRNVIHRMENGNKCFSFEYKVIERK